MTTRIPSSAATSMSDPAGMIAPSVASDALEAFVATHRARLVRLAWLVCRDATEADDAVQGALERAWRDRDALRDADGLRRWLDRIVVREAIRAGQRRRSWLGRMMGPGRPNEVEVEPVDRRSDAVEDWAELRSAFDDLPADQRAVLVLHLHAGYSVAETAAIVGAPAETVRSRLRLGKERLRREAGERP